MSEDVVKPNLTPETTMAEMGSKQTQSGEIVDLAEILSKMSTKAITKAQAVTLSAGANLMTLNRAPIMGQLTDRVGSFGDSSLSFTSILTTEVEWDEDYRTDQSELTSGQYAVDYDTGAVAYHGGAGGNVLASFTIRTLVTLDDESLNETISTALANSIVVANRPAILKELIVTNTLASAQFIQIHNATALPANGTTPKTIFYVGANQSVSYTPKGGLSCNTGITAANSSTAATLTAGSADCWFEARYE